MSKNDYIIRLERKEEYREVENLVREAFWNVYRPGCLEHYVLNQLRNDDAFVPELDFVIEKDGSVTDVRVVKGVSEELDAEALRVVKASPKWKPGRVNGNRVRTSLTIPIEFKLEKKGEKSSFGIKKY